MLARLRRATCALALAGVLAPLAQSQVIIRERVELPPPPSAALTADPLCVGGTIPGPLLVESDGPFEIWVSLVSAGDPDDSAYVPFHDTPGLAVGATVREAGGALRMPSASLEGHLEWTDGGFGSWAFTPVDPYAVLTLGEVVTGEVVEAVWMQIPGAPYPGASALAPAGAWPVEGVCQVQGGDFIAFEEVAGGASGIEMLLIEIVGAAPVPTGLVVTPDTLGRGGEAALALPPNAPSSPTVPVTLFVEDPAYGGFVTVPPAAGARSAETSPPQPWLTTTVGALPTVRFRVADDAPLGTVELLAAFNDGTSLEGSLTVSAPALFLRQDNTAFPADSCLMVSRTVPSVATLPPPPLAYADAPSGGTDPHAYRIEAASTSTGAHTFRVEVNPGQPDARAFTYPAVAGTGADAGRYRTDQSFRLVSNAAPATGADPNGVYDDAFAGDQTLLVRLGDAIRASLLDAAGAAVATADQTVGCASLPVGHTHAVRTAELYVRNYAGVSSQPAVMAERVSEDWAQGAIRFEFPAGNVGPDIVGVDNILVVQGSPSARGNIVISVTADPNGVPNTATIMVPVVGSDSEKDVADKITAAINAKVGFSAENQEFYIPGSRDPDTGYWVLVNKGFDVTYDIVSPVAGLVLRQLKPNYPPYVANTQMGDSEREALAWNFRSGPAGNIHIFVVPDGSLGLDAVSGGVVAGRTTYGSAQLASSHVVFIIESALDGSDAAFPMTLGHELGHALDVGHYVPGSPSNLMSAFAPPIGDDEVLTARKRLVQSQVGDARTSVFIQP